MNTYFSKLNGRFGSRTRTLLLQINVIFALIFILLSPLSATSTEPNNTSSQYVITAFPQQQQVMFDLIDESEEHPPAHDFDQIWRDYTQAHMPFQLMDINGNFTDLTHTEMTNNEWKRMQLLPKIDDGILPLGRFFSVFRQYRKGPAHRGEVFEQLLYKIPHQRELGFNYWNNPDPRSFPYDGFEDVKRSLFYHRTHHNLSSNYRYLKSAATRSNVKTYRGFAECFPAADQLWLYTGSAPSARLTQDRHAKLTWVTSRVYPDGYLIDFDIAGYGFLSEGRHGIDYACPVTASRAQALENPFRLYRVDNDRPDAKAYFKLDGSACDTKGRYCGNLRNARYTQDRFGSDNKALGLNVHNGAFELPIELFTTLKNKQQFAIGFWAEIAPHASPTLKPEGIFYGAIGTGDEAPVPMGLSMSFLAWRANQTISFNRHTRIEENSPRGRPGQFNWQFPLPAPFVIKERQPTQWVYFLIAYNENRTSLYMYNSLYRDGDWVRRPIKKQYILMDNSDFNDITRWGLGAASSEFGAVSAIDDVAIFDYAFKSVTSPATPAKEQYIRAIINAAVMSSDLN